MVESPCGGHKSIGVVNFDDRADGTAKYAKHTKKKCVAKETVFTI